MRQTLVVSTSGLPILDLTTVMDFDDAAGATFARQLSWRGLCHSILGYGFASAGRSSGRPPSRTARPGELAKGALFVFSPIADVSNT